PKHTWGRSSPRSSRRRARAACRRFRRRGIALLGLAALSAALVGRLVPGLFAALVGFGGVALTFAARVGGLLFPGFGQVALLFLVRFEIRFVPPAAFQAK